MLARPAGSARHFLSAHAAADYSKSDFQASPTGETSINASAKLAIHGGPPALPEGPPSWPFADPAVFEAMQQAYADGSWGRYLGPHCPRLVEQLAELHGVKHALLYSSGTLAVELALRGLGIRAGDDVVLAGYDFPGNFRAIEAIGARPVLADIEPATWCLDVAALERDWPEGVNAVVVSHLHGGMVDMPRLMEVAHAHEAVVVEDACQTPGGTVAGRMAGAWGDVGVLSFGGSKLLTAGRGGALVTQRDDVVQRLKIYTFRGNEAYPLSELQAAVLVPQVAKLAEQNAQRQTNVDRLLKATHNLPGLEPLRRQPELGTSSYYKLAWHFRPEQLGATREEFLAAVQAEGIALHAGFSYFARQSSRRCHRLGDLPNCQRAGESSVILHHPVLLEPAETIDRLAEGLTKVCEHFAKN